MKKIQLLYNPMAGDRSFRYDLDHVLAKFNEAGYQLHIYRSHAKGSMKQFFETFDPEGFEGVIVSGGDGSLNEAINGMLHHNIDLPLGVIPSGTSNDFARFLNMPDHVEGCLDVFLRRNLKKIDIGKANEQFFINVCSGGLFTTVSQNIDLDFKNTLGKMAYYIKGIEQLPNFKPFPLRITTGQGSIEEDFYVFLILNSTGAGGFQKLAKGAAIDDGLFELVAIRACPLHEIPRLFIQILRGEHLNEKNIFYTRSSEFYIECLSEDPAFYESDLDGEKGPNLPLKIQVYPKKLTVFSNI
ncbi:MAG: YegS/Rv2252/BmrU family lipid kinase [Epulopiscium sp.]|nr:YegS/Rv2252/BmrU family lipid kinase [Candidatus Epulonipiscium sp.]